MRFFIPFILPNPTCPRPSVGAGVEGMKKGIPISSSKLRRLGGLINFVFSAITLLASAQSDDRRSVNAESVIVISSKEFFRSSPREYFGKFEYIKIDEKLAIQAEHIREILVKSEKFTTVGGLDGILKTKKGGKVFLFNMYPYADDGLIVVEASSEILKATTVSSWALDNHEVRDPDSYFK